MTDSLKGGLAILTAFFLWSTTAPLLREANLPVATFIVLANFVGITVLVVFRGADLAGLVKKVPLGKLVGAGILTTLSVVLFFQAFLYTTIGKTLLFHYIAPVLVAAAAPFLLKEPTEPRTWIGLTLSIAGLLLLVQGQWGSTDARDLTGITLALLSAVTYAGALIIMRDLMRQDFDPVAVTIGQAGLMWVAVLPFAEMGAVTFQGFWVAGVAGILHLSIAAVLLAYGLSRVKAPAAASLGYTEIFFGMCWGALFYDEELTVRIVVGGVMIVTGGLLSIFGQNSDKFPSSERPLPTIDS